MAHPEEAELIRRCQRGDAGAFRELVERYQRRAHWIARNMINNYDTACEVSQEAFLRVFRNLARFDVRRNFYTWLYQIVVNLCIDRIRRMSHSRTVGLESAGGLADPRLGPAESGEKDELRSLVHESLDRLSPNYKAVLILRDIQGFSCKEIAQIVGCTHATVRWRLHHARKLFRALWEDRSALHRT